MEEEIINILHIGHEHPSLPKIGMMVENMHSIKSEVQVVGISGNKNVSFFVKICNEWTSTELQLVDSKDTFKRTPFSPKLLYTLKSSSVLIFGCGSGGSRLAIGLARAGIGELKLADIDRFSIENCSRHECDLLDLHRYKSDAVKERVLKINPFIKVISYHIDIFKSGNEGILNEAFENVSLVIGSTDNTSVQLAINHEAWQRKIPALFGGCYEEAKGGEVFYVLQDKETSCLECLRGGLKQPKRGKIDYSRARDEQDYKGEPGLHAAINFITDIEEQFAIALLLRNEDCQLAKLIEPQRNYILIGGALAEGFYIFQKPFQIIRPLIKGQRKDCRCCQNKPLSKSKETKALEEIEKMKKIRF